MMNIFLLIAVLLVLGIVLVFAFRYLEKEKYKQRFGGFEDRNDKEHEVLSRFRRQEDFEHECAKLDARVEHRSLDTEGNEQVSYDYPKVVTVKRIPTGLEFIYSLPKGMSAEDFEKCVEKGGNLFGNMFIEYSAGKHSNGYAFFKVNTREEGERNVNLEILN